MQHDPLHIDPDLAYVASLLRDEICRRARVTSWRAARPFGSTVAHQRLCDIELCDSVTIDPEDVETLPRRVRLELRKEGAEFKVTAQLRTDDGRQVTYHVQED